MSITAEEILTAKNNMVAQITSFNNTIGPDSPDGNLLGKLYDAYNLSNPPTQQEFNTMNTRDKIAYRKSERAFEMLAVNMNDIHEVLVAIDPGGGAFVTIDAVKTWATNNMGDVGADVATTLTAWTAIRLKLAPLVSADMLFDHSALVKAFMDSIKEQVDAGNIKV